MSHVTVMPDSAGFAIGHGENIRAAAIRTGYRWPSTCGGQAECMLCFVEIIEGEELFSEMKEKEAAAVKRLTAAMPKISRPCRLACQASVTGDVVVQKKGVRFAVRA